MRSAHLAAPAPATACSWSKIAGLKAGGAGQFALDAARPGVDHRLHLVEHHALSSRACIRLRNRRYVHLQKSAADKEALTGVPSRSPGRAVESRTPGRRSGKAAGDVRVLLALQLRGQLQ